MKKRKALLATAAVAALLLIAWLGFNPPGRFGWCRYALTTYGGIPRPVSDLQVNAAGETRTVDKTHDLAHATIQWLLDSRPEVLIIATGWDGVLEPQAKISELKEVRVLKNREAIQLFNELKKAGRRVAIHYHSTC
jgi:hypothetical protein